MKQLAGAMIVLLFATVATLVSGCAGAPRTPTRQIQSTCAATPCNLRSHVEDDRAAADDSDDDTNVDPFFGTDPIAFFRR